MIHENFEKQRFSNKFLREIDMSKYLVKYTDEDEYGEALKEVRCNTFTESDESQLLCIHFKTHKMYIPFYRIVNIIELPQEPKITRIK